MHAYIHAYIHTDIHTYRHTNIHTYIHTYVHTYIHTYMCTKDKKNHQIRHIFSPAPEPLILWLGGFWLRASEVRSMALKEEAHASNKPADGVRRLLDRRIQPKLNAEAPNTESLKQQTAQEPRRRREQGRVGFCSKDQETQEV